MKKITTEFCFLILGNNKRFEASYTREGEYHLQRTSLSRCRMIWLLPPSPVSKLSLFISLPVSHRSSLLTG
jgi:hypothetical protein